jgi:hypothetical protein
VRSRLIECHPEFSFCRLNNGTPMQTPKKIKGAVNPPMESPNALTLLGRHGFDPGIEDVIVAGPPSGAAMDDVDRRGGQSGYGRPACGRSHCSFSFESGALTVTEFQSRFMAESRNCPRDTARSAKWLIDLRFRSPFMCHDMSSFPTRLLEGYQTFMGGRYTAERQRYRELAETGQEPHTLVIACCDSRAAPETVLIADRASCSWSAMSPIWCRPTRRMEISTPRRRRSNMRFNP